MNKVKSTVALVLLVVFLVLGSVCLAEDRIQPYASELIVSRFIYSSALGNGKVEFTADMSTIKSVEKLGFPSIRVQEKNGTSWSTVKTVKNKYGYNTSIYDYTVSYTGTSGKQYRAVVSYYAKDGNITDTKSKTGTGITAD